MKKKHEIGSWLCALAAFLACPVLQAETDSDTGTDTQLSQDMTNEQRTSSVFGKLELRPSYKGNAQTFESQNEVDLGVRLARDTQLLLVQNFNFDMSGSYSSPRLPDARIEFDLNNRGIAEGYQFDYQPRLHLPTDPDKRAGGLLFSVKNQFNLHRNFGFYETNFAVIPTAHVLNHPSPKLPQFENGLEWLHTMHFDKDLRFGVPLKFYQARSGEGWNLTVTVKPELLYSIGNSYVLGAAYETGDFLDPNPFASGIAQFVLIAQI